MLKKRLLFSIFFCTMFQLTAGKKHIPFITPTGNQTAALQHVANTFVPLEKDKIEETPYSMKHEAKKAVAFMGILIAPIALSCIYKIYLYMGDAILQAAGGGK